jgi:hypothetical protein
VALESDAFPPLVHPFTVEDLGGWSHSYAELVEDLWQMEIETRLDLEPDLQLLDTRRIGMQDRLGLDSVTSASSDPELPLPTPRPISLAKATQAVAWEHVRLEKIGLFIASLFLFILAITLMKEGAHGLTPLVRGGFAITNPANSLGFGWLFAYVIMSGSPVAAAALTFFDAGVVDRLGAFAMITGSRLGASFIVLFIGFIYVLRGRDRATSLGIGLLPLTVTGTTYLAGLVVGTGLLQTGALNGVQLRSGMLLNSVMDLIFDPIANLLAEFSPGWVRHHHTEFQPHRSLPAADDRKGESGGAGIAPGLPALGDVRPRRSHHPHLNVGQRFPQHTGALE